MADKKKIKTGEFTKALRSTFRGTNELTKAIIAILVILIVVSHIRAHLEKRHKQKIPARPVHAAMVVKKDVPIYVDSFGTLAALNSADIKARVTGELKEIHFSEGDEVQQNDLLFVIDPDLYQAQLEKAEATVTASLANFKLDSDTFERNKTLFEQNLISQQEYDSYNTRMLVSKAQYELGKANLEVAKLDLDYCHVKAPISGRTGKRQVDIGNVVTANQGPVLVNIKTIENLYADFTVPEKYLTNIRNSMAGQQLRVDVTTQEGDNSPTYQGELKFLDNSVDDVTGTVSLRAIVSNSERKLWPGQFVNVRLILETEEGALLVPCEAVQFGQKGPYVFAVTKDNRADLRSVTVGLRQGDLIVIEEGVKEGEKVVTVGQMGLSPGVPVVEVDTTKKEK